MAHDSLPPPRAATSTSDASLARLYALWAQLRRFHHDAPGAAGIDYARPVVQCTPQTYEPMTLSPGSRTPDPVVLRLAAIRDDEARTTLVWLRGCALTPPSVGMDVDGTLAALLDACAVALATDDDRAGWRDAADAEQRAKGLDARGRLAHLTKAQRLYARGRLARACEVWGV